MPTSAKYVLDIPKISLEKHGSETHSAENLHSINGQTSSVMVVPHNNRLTIAWDCCILQYCLMAHFLKNEFASGLSVMVQRLAPSLKKQSPKLLQKEPRDSFFPCSAVSRLEETRLVGKGLRIRELALSQQRW